MKKGLVVWIMAAMGAGMMAGIVLGALPESETMKNILNDGILRVGAQTFLNMFKFIVVPVVFISLVNGVLSMENPAILGRIGLKTIALYLITTLGAIGIGLVTAYILEPGAGISMASVDTTRTMDTRPALSWADTIINIVPENIFAAFFGGNMLQVIFIAIFAGLALVMARKHTKGIISLFAELDRLNLMLIRMILYYAPVGVFCLLARIFAELGWHAIMPLSKYMLCIGAAYIALALIVYLPMLKFIIRVPVGLFMRKFSPVLAVAFSSSSSNAALPVNIDVSTNRLGIQEKISTFALSLGATINMNGTAIMQITAVIFISELYSVDLTAGQLGAIITTVLVSSIGTAGMPSAGVMMLGAALAAAGLPLDGIALIMGVDRLIDMVRTVVNVCGDTVCAAAVAASENALDRKILMADNGETSQNSV